MELNSFGAFDIMIRASLLLGIILMTFSHFILILKNRKANEAMETLKYYRSFWVQKMPIYSTYVNSILLGLAFFRIGSLLKVNMASTPFFSFCHITLIPGEEMAKYRTLILFVSVAGAILFIASSIFYNTAQLQIGKNYSLQVDIKSEYRLKTDELYGVVRHPMYLADIFLWLSAALTLFSWTLFLWTLCVHIPLYVHRAKAEEELLEHYWKENYSDYKAKTGRFFPYLKK